MEIGSTMRLLTRQPLDAIEGKRMMDLLENNCLTRCMTDGRLIALGLAAPADGGTVVASGLAKRFFYRPDGKINYLFRWR